MADKFDDALEELKDALTNGEELEAALAAVAADHDLRPEALRNRATLAWGDPAALRKRLSPDAATRYRRILAVRRYSKYQKLMVKVYKTKHVTEKEHLENEWYNWYSEKLLYEDLEILNKN